jgi:hypothetical protein
MQFVHPRSDFFRYPVPDDESFAPGQVNRDCRRQHLQLILTFLLNRYYKIIKRPIDLSAIKHKLSDGQYENRHQFKEDLDLIVHNCKTYNGEGSLVFEAAVEFEKVFTGRKCFWSSDRCPGQHAYTLSRSEWARVEKTLSKKAQTGPETVPAATTALKFNIKRPSVPNLTVTATGDEIGDSSAKPSLSVRTKDYAHPGSADKPRSAMKAGIKRQRETPAEEPKEIFTPLANSPPAKKKVKIVRPSVSILPKLKVSQPEPEPSAAVHKPVITLKRKLEAEPERSESRPSPGASMEPAQAMTSDGIAGPDRGNVKRLTEMGWTKDRTPFKRVRALRLIRDYMDKYRLLVSQSR